LNKNWKILLVLIVAIILVLSVIFGLIIVKKLNHSNKNDTDVQNNKKNPQQKSDNSLNCPECGGTGTITCPDCQGRGLYYICSSCGTKTYTYLTTCPGCGIMNSLVQHSCPTTVHCPECDGSGKIQA
jgi:predicted RNA-binding Zn-ribbon protein involved in translation (DUF1610 family)